MGVPVYCVLLLVFNMSSIVHYTLSKITNALPFNRIFSSLHINKRKQQTKNYSNLVNNINIIYMDNNSMIFKFTQLEVVALNVCF